MIKFFYDIETTGVKPTQHSIHQIAGIIEVDGVVAEEFDLKTRPHPKAKVEPEALKLCGVTELDLLSYPDMKTAHSTLRRILKKYVNPFEPKDRMHQVGFNNRAFDDIFLRKWFEQCGDDYYMSWFYPDSLDVMVLASQYLLDRRPHMPSFKLKRVAMELGIEVDKDKLHDGLYDVKLTREIYRIVTGIETEL